MMSIIFPKYEFKKKTFKSELIEYFKTNPFNKTPDANGCINLNIEQITWIINNFEHKKMRCDVLPFGKYKGKKIKDVAEFDRKYLIWLSNQDTLCDGLTIRKEIIKHI